MVDVVFPPSILKRYKEFQIISTDTKEYPSFGLIRPLGSDSTLLGTVPIGTIDVTGLPEFLFIARGTIQPGGKTGDAINGRFIAYIRDATSQADPIADGLKLGNTPSPTNFDSIFSSGRLSALTAAYVQGTNTFSAPATTRGNKLALDLYFIRQGNGVAPQDPGLWRTTNFEALLAILFFAQ